MKQDPLSVFTDGELTQNFPSITKVARSLSSLPTAKLWEQVKVKVFFIVFKIFKSNINTARTYNFPLQDPL
jgi:hypothetical protein